MAVTIQYLVVRNGIEKMTFINKKDADAYDKLLDLAEHLDEVLQAAPITLNETDREALALFLAENQDQLSGPKKQPAKKAPKAPKPSTDLELADAADDADIDASLEDESADNESADNESADSESADDIHAVA